MHSYHFVFYLPAMSHRTIRSYSNGIITVLWQPQKCRHSKICSTLLPEVFAAKHEFKIDIQASDSRTIAETILHCPSGALSYTPCEKRAVSETIPSPQQESVLL